MYKKSIYVVLIIFPLFLITLSIVYQGEPLTIISKIIGVVYPLKSFYISLVDKISEVKDFLRSHERVVIENKSMKEEIQRLKIKENMYDYCLNENIQLKKFLNYRYENNNKLVLVRVVDYIRSYSKDVVVVDAGENKGIKKGMYAITDLGLAGKVVETSNSFSHIRLLSDRRSILSVRSLSNQIRGIIQGEGRLNQRLTMKYIPMSSNVELNDIVVTAESIETYSVSGIPIGIIKDVRQFSKEMFQEAYIMPFVKFDSIDFMFIITESLYER